MSHTGQETTTPAWVPLRPGVLELGPDGQGRLLGSRCPACGACFFPPVEVCARCLNGELEQAPLGTRGTLYTFTVVHQSTPAFPAPYVLGYVDLPEGVRVLGQIAGVEPDDVRVGMELALSVEPFAVDDEGRQVLGYRFHPAVEGDGGA